MKKDTKIRCVWENTFWYLLLHLCSSRCIRTDYYRRSVRNFKSSRFFFFRFYFYCYSVVFSTVKIANAHFNTYSQLVQKRWLWFSFSLFVFVFFFAAIVCIAKTLIATPTPNSNTNKTIAAITATTMSDEEENDGDKTAVFFSNSAAHKIYENGFRAQRPERQGDGWECSIANG